MYLEGSLGMSVADQEANDYRGATEGGALKSTTNWSSPNIGANNSSGFTALPGGYRYELGHFSDILFSGGWWTSTEGSSSLSRFRVLDLNGAYVYRNTNFRNIGLSIRCIKN
jgi:uncharacterized protein (TIGR02145 family)